MVDGRAWRRQALDITTTNVFRLDLVIRREIHKFPGYQTKVKNAHDEKSTMFTPTMENGELWRFLQPSPAQAVLNAY